jgi:guanine deaminase
LVDAREWQGGLRVRTDTLLAVSALDGRIVCAEPYSAAREADLRTRFVFPAEGVTVLAPTQFLVPGFVDTHCHAPQFQFAGAGTDRDLMIWLQTYTFPAEKRMADVKLAQHVYARLVHAALSSGTTTAFYYGTIHLEATQALADACAQQGQRGFVGKVNMDQHSMDGYVESTEESLRDTETFIQYVKSLPRHALDAPKSPALVQPVVTPRFIPTCSPALLQGLGDLARKHDVWIQSHASESSDQVAFVLSLLPELGAAKPGADEHEQAGLQNGRCTGIFDHFGLLSNKCMMAHGTFLTPAEWNVFRARGTSIAHCPLSNYFCSDKYLKVKPLVSNGNKVGLGSDVAGGYALSILQNIRHAVVTSKVHTNEITTWPDTAVHLSAKGASHSKPSAEHAEPLGRPLSPEVLSALEAAKKASDNTVNGSTLSYADAFWLATAGGAEAAGLGHELGRFDAGFLFDAQLIDVAPVDERTGLVVSSQLSLFETDSLQDVVQKWMHLGDDRHVRSVFVQGRQVKGAEIPLPDELRKASVLPAALQSLRRNSAASGAVVPVASASAVAAAAGGATVAASAAQ